MLDLSAYPDIFGQVSEASNFIENLTFIINETNEAQKIFAENMCVFFDDTNYPGIGQNSEALDNGKVGAMM